jgi:vacuolar-type H+-ATPase subunit D/Vma8
MPLDRIEIQRSEHRALLHEVKRGVEVCAAVSDLRLLLQSLAGRLSGRIDKVALAELKRTIEACEEVVRLRVELAALERRLREFDEELTPVRPSSRMDIQAAFENSVDFASGKKKPPGPSGG